MKVLDILPQPPLRVKHCLRSRERFGYHNHNRNFWVKVIQRPARINGKVVHSGYIFPIHVRRPLYDLDPGEALVVTISTDLHHGQSQDKRV